MIYGYIRVSTDKQTVENQRFEIEQFATQQNLNVDRWIEETISGKKSIHKRRLGVLMKKLKKGDTIIASELSRFGRNSMQVMSFLEACMVKECQVWTLKERYRLGMDIQSQVLAFAFSISASIERELISQRTRETFKRLKAEGRKLGRPKGGHNRKMKLEGKENKIEDMLLQRIPKIHIARRMGVATPTLYRFIRSKFRRYLSLYSTSRNNIFLPDTTVDEFETITDNIRISEQPSV